MVVECVLLWGGTCKTFFVRLLFSEFDSTAHTEFCVTTGHGKNQDFHPMFPVGRRGGEKWTSWLISGTCVFLCRRCRCSAAYVSSVRIAPRK